MKKLRFKECFYLWLAYKLPKRLVYYCTVRAVAQLTSGSNRNIPLRKFRATDILETWRALSVREKPVRTRHNTTRTAVTA